MPPAKRVRSDINLEEELDILSTTGMETLVDTARDRFMVPVDDDPPADYGVDDRQHSNSSSRAGDTEAEESDAEAANGNTGEVSDFQQATQAAAEEEARRQEEEALREEARREEEKAARVAAAKVRRAQAKADRDALAAAEDEQDTNARLGSKKRPRASSTGEPTAAKRFRKLKPVSAASASACGSAWSASASGSAADAQATGASAGDSAADAGDSVVRVPKGSGKGQRKPAAGDARVKPRSSKAKSADRSDPAAKAAPPAEASEAAEPSKVAKAAAAAKAVKAAAKAAAAAKAVPAAKPKAAVPAAKPKAAAAAKAVHAAKPKAASAAKAVPAAKPKPQPKPKTTHPKSATEKELSEASGSVPGTPKFQWSSKEERRASLMRLIRSRDCDATTARTVKMPADIKKELQDDPSKQTAMHELWASCGEDWLKAQAYRIECRRRENMTRDGERYKTKGQLLEMYKNEVVVNAIIAGLPASHIRRHPNAKECDDATQYLVDCESGRDKLDSHIEETGTSQKADVDQAGGADLLNAIHSHLASTSSFSAAAGLSESERQKRKEAQQAKAAERAKLLETDMSERVKAWLKGINSDINKCQAAALEAKMCKDK